MFVIFKILELEMDLKFAGSRYPRLPLQIFNVCCKSDRAELGWKGFGAYLDAIGRKRYDLRFRDHSTLATNPLPFLCSNKGNRADEDVER